MQDFIEVTSKHQWVIIKVKIWFDWCSTITVTKCFQMITILSVSSSKLFETKDQWAPRFCMAEFRLDSRMWDSKIAPNCTLLFISQDLKSLMLFIVIKPPDILKK